MNNNDPVSLYIITQPNDKARLRPLVRVFLNMMIRLLADRMDFEDGRPVAHYKHRLLAMLDEFPSIGKLEVLQESLAFLAGYGIRFYLICQDLNQLKSRETGYGPDETVTSNCHVQNAYPPNRIETAEHLSPAHRSNHGLKRAHHYQRPAYIDDATAMSPRPSMITNGRCSRQTNVCGCLDP